MRKFLIAAALCGVGGHGMPYEGLGAPQGDPPCGVLGSELLDTG